MALFMAIFIWVIAEREENPVIKKPFPQRIPLEVLNKADNIIIFNDIPEDVELTIRASKDRWNSLSRDDFRAWIDLANEGPGYHELDVQASCSDRTVSILEIYPARVMVRLEEMVERETEVKITILDSPPLGYYIAGMPEASPPKVKVSGPKPYVDKVAELIAELKVAGAKESFEKKVLLTPVDAEGNEVKGVTVDPSTVLVYVPIEQRAGFRDASVLVKLEGQPAPGYRISNVSVHPSLVTLVGIPAVIDNVPGYVETEPVNIENAKGSFSRRVRLNLPEGVSVLGIQTVMVNVEIKPIEGGITLEKEVTFQGLEPGFDATASPQMVSVILAGPLPKLEALRPEDVEVAVNVLGLGPGVYKLKPKVLLPEGIRVESILPDTVEVVVFRFVEVEETPTPIPTP